MSAMSRLDPLKRSDLDVQAFQSHEARQAVSILLHIISSCAGPNGKNHIIRNACGGHMTITSSSSRLLSAIMISRNELKMIVSAILSHIHRHADCGLFMAFTTLKLIKSVTSLDIPHFIAASTLNTFSSIICSYLSSSDCEVIVNVDFSNIQILLAYVRSVLNSKTLLNLQKTECNRLCHLVVETFVNAIPSIPKKCFSDCIFVVGVENQPICNSKIMKGLLLSCPESLQYDYSNISSLRTCSKTTNGGGSVVYIKTILVTCSMSGDIEELDQTNFEGTEDKFILLESTVTEKLNTFCALMASLKVGMVLCQKVIHPCVKTVLKSYGIFFVDRLGAQIIPYLRDLTGCKPLSSIFVNEKIAQDCVGKLCSVKRHTDGRHEYLLLNSEDADVATLVICAEWEERVSELKICVNTCLRGLSQLSRESKFLMGGGCWQMNCIAFLENQVMSDLPETLKELKLPQTQLHRTLSAFTSVMRSWCQQLKGVEEHLSFDPLSGHSWRVPKGIISSSALHCCCGLKSTSSHYLRDLEITLDATSPFYLSRFSSAKKSDVEVPVIDILSYDHAIFDSFSACLNALRNACMTASMLMSVNQFVIDRN